MLIISSTIRITSKTQPSKVTESIFCSSIIWDFQSGLIFINKAFQSAATQNQRHYKDNLLLPAWETLEKTQVATWEVLNTSDLTAITHEVKVDTSEHSRLLKKRHWEVIKTRCLFILTHCLFIFIYTTKWFSVVVQPRKPTPTHRWYSR